MLLLLVGALGIAVLGIVLAEQKEKGGLLQQLEQERLEMRREVEGLREDLKRAREGEVQVNPLPIDLAELDRLRQAEGELLRLRSEVTRLRNELKRVAPDAGEGIVLRNQERFETPESYQPPVEITVVAKTDSTNLRLAYAADQVIFNWELDESQLRVDGGPASGQHRAGAGTIPAGEYVTIRWIVTGTNQQVFVNDELRFEHQGDYSGINRPVSIFPSHGSTVTIRGFEVKRLGGG